MSPNASFHLGVHCLTHDLFTGIQNDKHEDITEFNIIRKYKALKIFKIPQKVAKCKSYTLLFENKSII